MTAIAPHPFFLVPRRPSAPAPLSAAAAPAVLRPAASLTLLPTPYGLGEFEKIIDLLGRIWDPLKHPRDSEGKFIRTFSSVHYTPRNRAKGPTFSGDVVAFDRHTGDALVRVRGTDPKSPYALTPGQLVMVPQLDLTVQTIKARRNARKRAGEDFYRIAELQSAEIRRVRSAIGSLRGLDPDRDPKKGTQGPLSDLADELETVIPGHPNYVQGQAAIDLMRRVAIAVDDAKVSSRPDLDEATDVQTLDGKSRAALRKFDDVVANINTARHYLGDKTLPLKIDSGRSDNRADLRLAGAQKALLHETNAAEPAQFLNLHDADNPQWQEMAPTLDVPTRDQEFDSETKDQQTENVLDALRPSLMQRVNRGLRNFTSLSRGAQVSHKDRFHQDKNGNLIVAGSIVDVAASKGGAGARPEGTMMVVRVSTEAVGDGKFRKRVLARHFDPEGGGYTDYAVFGSDMMEVVDNGSLDDRFKRLALAGADVTELVDSFSDAYVAALKSRFADPNARRRSPLVPNFFYDSIPIDERFREDGTGEMIGVGDWVVDQTGALGLVSWVTGADKESTVRVQFANGQLSSRVSSKKLVKMHSLGTMDDAFYMPTREEAAAAARKIGATTAADVIADPNSTHEDIKAALSADQGFLNALPNLQALYKQRNNDLSAGRETSRDLKDALAPFDILAPASAGHFREAPVRKATVGPPTSDGTTDPPGRPGNSSETIDADGKRTDTDTGEALPGYDLSDPDAMPDPLDTPRHQADRWYADTHRNITTGMPEKMRSLAAEHMRAVAEAIEARDVDEFHDQIESMVNAFTSSWNADAMKGTRLLGWLKHTPKSPKTEKPVPWTQYFKDYDEVREGGLFGPLQPATTRPTNTDAENPEGVSTSTNTANDEFSKFLQAGGVGFLKHDGTPLEEGFAVMDHKAVAAFDSFPTKADLAGYLADHPISGDPDSPDGNAVGLWLDPNDGRFRVARFRTFPPDEQGRSSANDHAVATEANQFLDIATGEVFNVSGTGTEPVPTDRSRERAVETTPGGNARVKARTAKQARVLDEIAASTTKPPPPDAAAALDAIRNGGEITPDQARALAAHIATLAPEDFSDPDARSRSSSKGVATALADRVLRAAGITDPQPYSSQNTALRRSSDVTRAAIAAAEGDSDTAVADSLDYARDRLRNGDYAGAAGDFRRASDLSEERGAPDKVVARLREHADRLDKGAPPTAPAPAPAKATAPAKRLTTGADYQAATLEALQAELEARGFSPEQVDAIRDGVFPADPASSLRRALLEHDLGAYTPDSADAYAARKKLRSKYAGLTSAAALADELKKRGFTDDEIKAFREASPVTKVSVGKKNEAMRDMLVENDLGNLNPAAARGTPTPRPRVLLPRKGGREGLLEMGKYYSAGGGGGAFLPDDVKARGRTAVDALDIDQLKVRDGPPELIEWLETATPEELRDLVTRIMDDPDVTNTLTSARDALQRYFDAGELPVKPAAPPTAPAGQFVPSTGGMKGLSEIGDHHAADASLPAGEGDRRDKAATAISVWASLNRGPEGFLDWVKNTATPQELADLHRRVYSDPAYAGTPESGYEVLNRFRDEGSLPPAGAAPAQTPTPTGPELQHPQLAEIFARDGWDDLTDAQKAAIDADVAQAVQDDPSFDLQEYRRNITQGAEPGVLGRYADAMIAQQERTPTAVKAPSAADLFRDDGWDDLDPDEQSAIERALADALAENPDLDLQDFRREVIGGEEEEEPTTPAPALQNPELPGLLADDGWDDLTPEEQAAVDRALVDARAENPDLDLQEFRREILGEEPKILGEEPKILGEEPPKKKLGGLKAFAQQKKEHYALKDKADAEAAAATTTTPATVEQAEKDVVTSGEGGTVTEIIQSAHQATAPTPVAEGDDSNETSAQDKLEKALMDAIKAKYPELQAVVDKIAKLPDEQHEPNEQQKWIIAAIQTGKSAIVMALAGTGKTSTLLAAARRMTPGQRALYMAFNVSVRAEAQEKFPDHVEARTINSMAYVSFMRKGLEGKKFREKLEKGIADANGIAVHVGIAGRLYDDRGRQMSDSAAKGLVEDAVHNYMISADDNLEMKHVEPLNLDSKAAAEVLRAAQRMWNDYKNPNGRLKFDQDAMVKMWALERPDFRDAKSGIKTPLKDTDILFFDEAQDINDVVGRVVRDNVLQTITVGDSNQAIYGFRGAEDQLSKMTAPYTLALTKSYRYGHGVGSYGNRGLQLIGTDQRLIGVGPESAIYEPHTMRDSTALIMRTNKGALSMALEEMEHGRVVGVSAKVRTNLRNIVETVGWFRDGNPKPDDYKIHPDIKKFMYRTDPKTKKRTTLSPADAWEAFKAAATDPDRPDRDAEKILNLVDKFKPEELKDILDNVRVVTGKPVEIKADDLNEETSNAGSPIALGDNLQGYVFDGGKKFAIVAPEGDSDATIRNKELFKPMPFAGNRVRWDGEAKRWWVPFDQNNAATREQMVADLTRLQKVVSPKIDVVITTAHMSKGLEWDRVRVGDDWFTFHPEVNPVTGQETPPNPKPEERRLAYVALTRAKEALDPGDLAIILEDLTIPEPGEQVGTTHDGRKEVEIAEKALDAAITKEAIGGMDIPVPVQPGSKWDHRPVLNQFINGTHKAEWDALTPAERRAATRRIVEGVQTGGPRHVTSADDFILLHADNDLKKSAGEWAATDAEWNDEEIRILEAEGGGASPLAQLPPDTPDRIHRRLNFPETSPGVLGTPVNDLRPPVADDDPDVKIIRELQAERQAEFDRVMRTITPNASRFLAAGFEGIGGGIFRSERSVAEADFMTGVGAGAGSAEDRTLHQTTAAFSVPNNALVISDRSLALHGSNNYGHAVSHELGHALDAQLISVVGAPDEKSIFFSTNDAEFLAMRARILDRTMLTDAQTGKRTPAIRWYFLNRSDAPGGEHNGNVGTQEMFAQGYSAYAAAMASGVDMSTASPEQQRELRKMGATVTLTKGMLTGATAKYMQARNELIGRQFYNYFHDLETNRLPEIMKSGSAVAHYQREDSKLLREEARLPAASPEGEISPGVTGSKQDNPRGGPTGERNGSNYGTIPEKTRTKLNEQLVAFAQSIGSSVRSIEDMRDNVLASIRAASRRERAHGLQWYGKARDFARDLGGGTASDYNWHVNAATVAATSPKTRWEANQVAADLIQRSYDPKLSPEIDEKFLATKVRVRGKSFSVRSMLQTDPALKRAVAKSQGLDPKKLSARQRAKLNADTKRFVDEQLAVDLPGGGRPQLYQYANEAFRNSLVNAHNRVIGRQQQIDAGVPISKLDGMGMRYRVTTTDGETITTGDPHKFAGIMRTQMTAVNGIYNYRGTPVDADSVLMPEGFDPVPRTDEQVYDNINRALNGHKTRSFYNNIVTGGESELSTTIDTHMLDAMLLGALASRSGVFAPGKADFLALGGSAAEGRKGTYPLFQEGMRQAVESLVGELTDEQWTMAKAQAVSWVTTLAGSESSWMVNTALTTHDPVSALRRAVGEGHDADADAVVEAFHATRTFGQANRRLKEAGVDFQYTAASYSDMRDALRDPWAHFNDGKDSGTTIRLNRTNYAAAAHLASRSASADEAKRAIDSLFFDEKIEKRRKKHEKAEAEKPEGARSAFTEKQPEISPADAERLREIGQGMMTLDQILQASHLEYRKRILDAYNRRRRSMGITANPLTMGELDEVLQQARDAGAALPAPTAAPAPLTQPAPTAETVVPELSLSLGAVVRRPPRRHEMV